MQRSTKQVAEVLGIPPGRLARAVWDRRVAAPGKGPGGDYQWTLGDIRRASWVMLRRDYREEPLQDRDGADQGGAK
ncbi:MAG: hypothetical protein WCK05_10005 [Planctomycetota bacterium]